MVVVRALASLEYSDRIRETYILVPDLESLDVAGTPASARGGDCRSHRPGHAGDVPRAARHAVSGPAPARAGGMDRR